MNRSCSRRWCIFMGAFAFSCMPALFAAPMKVAGHDIAEPLNVTLAPVVNDRHVATGVSVQYALSPSEKTASQLDLMFDTLAPSLLRTSDQVTALRVSDEKGKVALQPPALRHRDDGVFQVWSATRPTAGVVHVAYVVPVAAAKTSKRGPQIDLQAAGGGLSGAFVSFLLLPDSHGRPFHVHVHWRLPAGQMAVSSYGVGDYAGDFGAGELGDTLFLAGPVKTYSASGPGSRFHVYALGLPADQLKAAARWTTRAYQAEREAFHVPVSQPYRFLIRSYDGGPMNSGRSSHDSFMLYLPPGADAGHTDLHSLVAHEMVHSLMKDFDDAPGDEGDWYTEGTADYFSITLPWKAGLYTARQYVGLVNAEAAEYYDNALRTVSNKQISKVMWSGRNAWMLPYGRGAIYLADLDAKLRLHHANVSVLDLVNATSERIEHGTPATNAAWEAVLKDKAGVWAIADWRHMMAGHLIMPTPGAFGPCLIGEATRVGLFDLGFAKPVRVTAGSRVSGVVKGSSADRAGLRNGDVITKSIDINPIAASFDSSIHIPVRRGASSMVISYKPRSKLVQAMKWHLSPAEAHQKCVH